MLYLHLQIVRFVDEAFPGFVAGVFTDAHGIQHTIVDKVPVIGLSDLWLDSEYPQPGVAACERLETRNDSSVTRISIAKPWGLESTNGQTEFSVFASQSAEERENWPWPRRAR